MKKICVLDADSIVIGFVLELGGIKLIDWLSRIFQIYIPFFVIKQELKKTSKDYNVDVEEIRRKLYALNVKVIANEYFSHCLDFAENWLNESDLSIDDGERFCLALSLYLSRNFNDFVFLITDDFRARSKALDEFVDMQKIGVALSSPDIILHSFARNRNISGDQTLRSFQDFFSKMPAKKTLYLEIKKRYMQFYERICRKAGLSRHLCTQQCFSGSVVPMPHY